MNTNDARKILSYYRPGSDDARDPAFADALEFVRRQRQNGRQPDPEGLELVRWFDERCAQYSAARARFQSISVPPGLKEQILAERRIVEVPFRKKNAVAPWLAAAAAVIVLVALVFLALRPTAQPSQFVACRNQMVRVALSPYYGMDLVTNNADCVRAFLAQRSAPANYALPPRLAKSQLVGCAIEQWNNSPVSMICFRSGRPLAAGDAADLWLFVMDSRSAPGAPSAGSLAFVPVSRASTASWTRDHTAYILVGSGDKAFLEQYLD